ncbi:hypothetical protein CBR_g55465 [Chara braunii]|uniref:Uncharacterized protein n=1 Tax=Chara braunii TaxID=69332 RepID=A0A388K7W1_CHABU|nr:hypothetical protein CBR_g55465 [Chara braunii]|eukprot:GBG66121.1 hypothetical protein CBR_g55465 [Chara braunii]
MELGVTWYVHCSRHFFYPPGEAQTNTDECGLSGYWFHSMAELLDKVRDSMHDLASDGGGEGTVAVEGGGGGGGGEDVRRREVVSMTLRSLLELSQQNIACCWHRAGSEGMVASHVQDLPQTSRCRHDVDAGIDFAREQGYLTMLQVIKCSALDTEHIRLAAQIVAGFASGLSVLPWQPHQRLHGEHWILGMLCDDDFTYWTKNLVRTLVQLVQRRCVAEEELTPSAIVAGTRGEDVKRRPLQKAAMSAICSLANAASDIHAHYHDHLRLRGIAEGREEGEEKVFLQGELAYSSRPSNTVSPKSPKSPNQLGKRYLSYASRLSNGFTTLCPVGWMLESEIPDFTQASTVWAECVKSVLTEESTLDILLAWVTSVPNDSDNIAADSLRILASLWSCRMISWHRFDQRLPADFPPPMDTIKAGTVRDRLKQLVCRCSKHDPKALSSFSKLHLAKILISQNIRGLDSDVTEILLQCLCFWRLALGKRDMDWFACETMETLRDLLTTSNEPDKLRCLIFASPGGENCLRLMLNGDVSRFLSVRFFEERALFNHKLSQYMLKNDWKKPWAVDAEVDVARCVATAAALFGDLLCLNPKPSQLSQVSPYLDTVRGAPVIRTLYQSLCSIVDTPDIQQRVTDKQSTTFPPSFISSFTEALASYNLFPRLVLLVWESLGNPGWRPPFGLFDDINSVLIDASENRMEYFERSVNCLLGMRNATRVLHLLLARHQVLVSSDLLPTLVRLLIIPYPKLQRRLGLQNWEREVHYQIKEHVADMVMLVLPRLEKDLKGQDGPKPLTSTTLSVLSELQLWTAKEDQMDKEKRRRDIEGGTGCGPKVQCLLNHLNVIQGLTGMAMAQQSPTKVIKMATTIAREAKLKINVEGEGEEEMRKDQRLKEAITEAKNRATRRCRMDGVTMEIQVTVSCHETEVSSGTTRREQQDLDHDSEAILKPPVKRAMPKRSPGMD